MQSNSCVYIICTNACGKANTDILSFTEFGYVQEMFNPINVFIVDILNGRVIYLSSKPSLWICISF